MRDRQTGSRWQQATGECFEGPLQGQRLELYPFLLTTWKEWRTRHPETLALVPDPQHSSDYQRIASRMEESSFGGGPRLRGLLHQDDRLPPREQIVGLEVGGAQKAYPLAALKKQEVVNDHVGTAPALLVYEARSQTVTAFSRRLEGRALTFVSLESSPIQLRDKETGSTWNTYGECIRGPLKGKKLEALTPLPSFWFSWAEFFPKTEVYKVN